VTGDDLEAALAVCRPSNVAEFVAVVRSPPSHVVSGLMVRIGQVPTEGFESLAGIDDVLQTLNVRSAGTDLSVS
jgi:hypothetical protein